MVWREISWWLALKFVALGLLWWLFFSPSHRPHVDSWTTGRKFGVDSAVNAAAQGPRLSTPKEKTSD